MTAPAIETGKELDRAKVSAFNRSWFRAISNYVFGFDFFISYAHADSLHYAEQLANTLDSQGFECFLDAEDYAAGDDWKQAGRLALRRTSRLILIGSPAALKSDPVLREVNTFGELGRRVIPIDIGNALGSAEDSALVQAIGTAIIRIPESADALAAGPSESVVNRIRDSFDLVRQHQRRQRTMTAATFVFGVLAILAGVLAWQANLARQDAEAALARAERETRRVKAGELAARSDQVAFQFPERSVLLAVEAVRVTEQDGLRLPVAEQALRNRLRRLSPSALSGPGHALESVTLTAADRWILGLSEDGGIWLWDLTAKDPWRTSSELAGKISGRSSLNLGDNGQVLTAGDTHGTIRFWDLQRDQPWDAIQPVHTDVGSITAVRMNGDGRWLAVAGDSNALRVQTLRSGPSMQPAPFALTTGDPLTELRFSADDRWIIGTSASGKAWLWDRTGGERPNGLPLVPEDRVLQELFLGADSRWLVILTEDDNLLWWDLTDPYDPALPHVSDHWQDSVWRAALSGDGRFLFTETNAGSLLVWPMFADWSQQNYRELWQSPSVEEDPWDDEMALDPSEDGRWLVATLGRFDWGIWDLRSGDPARFRRIAGWSEVRDQSISADGKTVAVLTESGITVWDLGEVGPPGEIDAEIPSARTVATEPEIATLRLSPNGRWLVVSTTAGHVLLHDLTTQGQIWKLEGSEDGLKQAVFGADWLLVLGHQGTARLWELGELAAADSPMLLSLPDRGRLRYGTVVGDWLYAGTYRDSYRWDLSVVPITRTRELLANRSVRAVTADGRWELSQASGQPAELRDLHSQDSKARVRTLPGASVPAGTQIDVYGDWLMIKRDNRYGWLYDIADRDPPREPIVLHEDVDSLRNVVVSPDGEWLLIRFDDTVGLWDLTAVEPFDAGDEVTPDGESASAVAITRDARWALIGSESGAMRLIGLESDDPFAAPLDVAAHDDEILRFVTSPGGRWMLAVSRDEVARIWDMNAVAPSLSGRVLDGGGAPLWPEPFSPDDRWLLTKGKDGRARLWDLVAGNDDFFLLDRGSQINRAWMLPGNVWLVTLDGDQRLHLWDLRAADPARRGIELRATESEYPKIEFSRNGAWLATFGSGDTDVRLWDMAAVDPSQSQVLLRGHTSDVTGARFTPDNRWLVTGSDDDTIRLWPLEMDHLLELAGYVSGRNLSSAEWDLYFPRDPYRKTFPRLRSDDAVATVESHSPER